MLVYTWATAQTQSKSMIIGTYPIRGTCSFAHAPDVSADGTRRGLGNPRGAPLSHPPLLKIGRGAGERPKSEGSVAHTCLHRHWSSEPDLDENRWYGRHSSLRGNPAWGASGRPAPASSRKKAPMAPIFVQPRAASAGFGADVRATLLPDLGRSPARPPERDHKS